MKNKFKKVTLILLLLVGFLFIGTACEPLNNLFDNLSSGIEQKNTDTKLEEFITVTFDFSSDYYENISLMIKRDQNIYEPVNPYLSDHKFKGWYFEDEKYNFKTKVTKDITLKANWEINNGEQPIDEDNFLITFDYNMPKFNSVTIKVEKGNKTIEPIAPERIGYNFLGWFLDLDSVESFDFSKIVTNDLRLIAKWKETSIVPLEEDVNVTFIFANELSPMEIKIPHGTKVLEPKAPTKEGYTFSGWTNNFDDKEFNFQSHVTNDLVLEAQWQEGNDIPIEPIDDDVRITFNFSASEIPKLVEIKIKKGTKSIEPKAPTYDKFVFIGWFKDKDDVEAFDFNTTINADLGLIAKWEPEKYLPQYNNITFISYGDEFIVNTIEAERDFGITRPVDPVKEYHNFLGWYEEESSTKFDFDNTLVERDYVLIARWELEEKQVNVLFEYNNEDIIVKVDLGSTVNEPVITLDPNYTLVGWKDENGNFFDFSTPIYRHITLEAVIYPLMENHFNYISQHVMRGNVKIIKTLYANYNSGIPSRKLDSFIGSGVIIKQELNTYYVLTNHHVISKSYKLNDGNYTDAAAAIFIIEDYLSREHDEVELVLDGLEEVGHDLAILKFTPKDVLDDLEVINVSTNFNESGLLTTVGQPQGQKNTITVGTYVSEITISLILNGLQRPLRSIEITNPGAGGSSGSMVINQSFEIVGLIFAGPKDVPFTDSTKMYAVPLDVIQDFLIILQNKLDNSLVYNNNLMFGIFAQI